MAATIKEIADRAGVSIATVSRALNNDKKVTDETRKLIKKISEELNYKPNLLARNFAKKTSNIIGLVLPDISDEFFTDIIKGVDEATYRHGFYTMVASSHKYRTLEESFDTLVRNGLIGGIILMISSINNKIKDIIKESKLPIILISGATGNTCCDTVSIDNYQGAYDMTEYLIVKKKYRKIAHITGPLDNDDSCLRQKGFIDACKKHKVEVPEAWVLNGDFTRESGEECCSRLLNLSHKPEVIFASNDMMAVGCYDTMAKKGLKIPRHIAIAGFDDIFLSRYLSPGLSTVKVNIEDVGRRAADILIRRIRGDKTKKNYKIKVSTGLVIRNSC